MARTAITVHNLAGRTGLANGAVAQTGGDSTNDHEWALKDGDILLARNTGAGNESLSLITQPDALGRSISIAQTHNAGQVRTYGPLTREGFAQADGTCHVDLAVDTWELAVIRDVGN